MGAVDQRRKGKRRTYVGIVHLVKRTEDGRFEARSRERRKMVYREVKGKRKVCGRPNILSKEETEWDEHH